MPLTQDFAVLWTAAALTLLLPAHSAGATKPQLQATAPSLVPIRKAHCHQMYGLVEKRLKGRGNAVVSAVTRNGLKDFFVTRPGVIDCSGERQIPWQDGKDRDFIAAILKATDAALKSRVDMATHYGIGPAPAPVKPVTR
jgi:hypothetical protein